MSKAEELLGSVQGAAQKMQMLHSHLEALSDLSDPDYNDKLVRFKMGMSTGGITPQYLSKSMDEAFLRHIGTQVLNGFVRHVLGVADGRISICRCVVCHM